MRVRASSLNYRDLMALKGGGRGPTKLGVVPLSDGTGEVAAIGDGVTRVKLGDRIIGTFHPRWFGGPLSADYLTDRLGANLDGMLAECAVLSEEALVLVPKHLSFEGKRCITARYKFKAGPSSIGGPLKPDCASTVFHRGVRGCDRGGEPRNPLISRFSERLPMARRRARPAWSDRRGEVCTGEGHRDRASGIWHVCP